MGVHWKGVNGVYRGGGGGQVLRSSAEVVQGRNGEG
ncbi:hypothetical protein Hamer_G010563 [Homarus americanus]|uniref:Uncharacterized protein n=1 Tax=Homarus americanus TaxID=6706 RepID=A0A8J5J5R8_HOMAM|nr:hypothetical protein Hamer_G010563 [Homarus americanus]